MEGKNLLHRGVGERKKCGEGRGGGKNCSALSLGKRGAPRLPSGRGKGARRGPQEDDVVPWPGKSAMFLTAGGGKELLFVHPQRGKKVWRAEEEKRRLKNRLKKGTAAIAGGENRIHHERKNKGGGGAENLQRDIIEKGAAHRREKVRPGKGGGKREAIVFLEVLEGDRKSFDPGHPACRCFVLKKNIPEKEKKGLSLSGVCAQP